MEQIPKYAANRVLLAAKNDILAFYDNEENVKEFEEWKKARAERKLNNIVPYVGKEDLDRIDSFDRICRGLGGVPVLREQ